MDYSAQGLTPQVSSNDKRRSPRKSMRQKVTLGTAGQGIVQGQTRDISASGLSVMIAMPLALKTVCAVRFDLMVDGRVVRFSGSGKVVHCSCAGMEGFRIGMQIEADDVQVSAMLDKFMST